MKLLVSFLSVTASLAFVSRSNVEISSTKLAAEATFGMGCFWKPSEELLKVPGVQDTIVGYTGRNDVSDPPSYDEVCFGRGWVEGVRVIYDDTKLSYDELLDAFFDAQEPKLNSRQYASVIFPHDDEQRRVAESWLTENKLRNDGVSTAMTTIENRSRFFRAEDYHQQYWQKTRPRVAGLIALLAVSSGAIDDVLPIAVQSVVHTAANAIVIAGNVFLLVERRIGRSTVLE